MTTVKGKESSVQGKKSISLLEKFTSENNLEAYHQHLQNHTEPQESP